MDRSIPGSSPGHPGSAERRDSSKEAPRRTPARPRTRTAQNVVENVKTLAAAAAAPACRHPRLVIVEAGAPWSQAERARSSRA